MYVDPSSQPYLVRLIVVCGHRVEGRGGGFWGTSKDKQQPFEVRACLHVYAYGPVRLSHMSCTNEWTGGGGTLLARVAGRRAGPPPLDAVGGAGGALSRPACGGGGGRVVRERGVVWWWGCKKETLMRNKGKQRKACVYYPGTFQSASLVCFFPFAYLDSLLDRSTPFLSTYVPTRPARRPSTKDSSSRPMAASSCACTCVCLYMYQPVLWPIPIHCTVYIYM